MTFKEYLISTGLTEEQANKITDGMPENNLYIASEEKLDERYAKLKEQKEQAESDLESANKLVTDLQKSNKDVEGLQTKISEYQAQVEKMEGERSEERKTYAIKEALQSAGAKDVDYLMFKLGEVEVNKDGSIKNLDNKVKELKENNPNFFGTEEKEDNTRDYEVIDNKLDKGEKSTVYSFDQLKSLSADEINSNWEAVSAALEKGDDK